MSSDTYKVIAEIRYKARLHEVHARLFGRLRAWINYVSLFSGSSAAIAIMSSHTLAGTIASITVVALTLVDQNWDFGGLSAAHTDARKRYLKLLATKQGRSAEKLEGAYEQAMADTVDIHVVEALRFTAQNDVLRELGHVDAVCKETFWQGFMRVVA